MQASAQGGTVDADAGRGPEAVAEGQRVGLGVGEEAAGRIRAVGRVLQRIELPRQLRHRARPLDIARGVRWQGQEVGVEEHVVLAPRADPVRLALAPAARPMLLATLPRRTPAAPTMRAAPAALAVLGCHHDTILEGRVAQDAVEPRPRAAQQQRAICRCGRSVRLLLRAADNDLDRDGITTGPLEEVQHLQFNSVGAILDQVAGCILKWYVLVPARIADNSKDLVVDFDV